MELNYIIQENEQSKTVLEILKTRLQISERLLYKLKKHQKIFLNGIHTFPETLLRKNDKITVIIDFEENSDNILPIKMNLNIIYEDDAYIVINKEANMTVHPSMDHYTDSLSNGLKYYFNEIQLKRKIRPVNRIDKNTSGIVIFAKNEYVQELFIRQMKINSFYKEYIAICEGIFEKKSDIINVPIARKENSIIERCVHNDGDPAITSYEVLGENINNNYSIIKCILQTGRTHQIRVHMSHLGHPILGDSLYGNCSNLINRQALHSHIVSFKHPITNNVMTHIAPIPDDIQKLIY